MPTSKKKPEPTTQEEAISLRCPFCDQPVAVVGHTVNEGWVTACPNIEILMTPGRALAG